MRAVKTAFGMIAALVPIIYCGGLIYYFVDLTGSTKEAVNEGLGPTLLGLGAVGLLVCIPFAAKIVRLFTGRHPPGSRGDAGPDGPPSKGGFDADAAIARYLARQPSGAADSAAPRQASQSAAAAQGPGFGRKRT